MTNVYKINQECRRRQGETYRFIRCFHSQRDEFNCDFCGNRGKHGYIIQNIHNEQEELHIGEKCLKDNFMIQVSPSS